MKRARHGFTLIELLVIITLLALTAGLAVPSLTSILQSDRQAEPVRAVRVLLESSRSLALARGTRIELVVDSADGRYWIYAHEDSVYQLATGSLQFTNGTRLQLARARARFVWDARSVGVVDTLVVITDAGHTPITVVPWTGRVLAR